MRCQTNKLLKSEGKKGGDFFYHSSTLNICGTSDIYTGWFVSLLDLFNLKQHVMVTIHILDHIRIFSSQGLTLILNLVVNSINVLGEFQPRTLENL